MQKAKISYIKILIMGFVLMMLPLHAAMPNSERFETYKLIKSALKCNIAMETVAKSYLYMGSDKGVRQAKADMKQAFNIFDENFKRLYGATNSPKIKNLLNYSKLNYDELVDVIKKPYSLDNAQELMDYVAVISEASRHIAELYKDKIHYRNEVDTDGLRPQIKSIAKYYIAYQAGIKDENMIHQMKKAVEFCDKAIEARVANPDNTVKMNQNIKRAKNPISPLKNRSFKFEPLFLSGTLYIDISTNTTPKTFLKNTTSKELI